MFVGVYTDDSGAEFYAIEKSVQEVINTLAENAGERYFHASDVTFYKAKPIKVTQIVTFDIKE